MAKGNVGVGGQSRAPGGASHVATKFGLFLETITGSSGSLQWVRHGQICF